MENEGNRKNNDFILSEKNKECIIDNINEEIHVTTQTKKDIPHPKTREHTYSFVTENIKHTNKSKRREKFKKGVAVACVATTMITFTFLGATAGGVLYSHIKDGNTSVDAMSVRNSIDKDFKKIFGSNSPDISVPPIEKNGNNIKPQPSDAPTFYINNDDAPPLSAANNNISAVVKKVANSVVSINTESQEVNMFNQVLAGKGAGSGIIFKEDGEKIYIATNNHVIDNATKVTISINDESQAPAKFVGSDPMSDLAVISVSLKDLKDAGIIKYSVAQFGDSEILEVGESVVAIGNALGEGKSATLGIVSAKNKQINVDGKKLSVIQTDAAINSGNSGGALVNGKGQVVGINTAKLASTGIEGVGFSIPINSAKIIIDQLMTNGSVEKPYLGIKGLDVTEEIKNMYHLPSIGVYVANVMPKSAASEAGLVEGDIVVGYGKDKIESMEELSKLINATKVGTKVNLYVYRDNSVPTVLEAIIKNSNNEAKF